MRPKIMIPVLTTLIILSSCAPVTISYFQVYKVQPVEETVTKSDNLVYEDVNCIITYNLWANGGNIGFEFHNKTDEKIYVNLKESSFIINGYANDYYKNRTFTSSEGSSTSMSTTSIGAVALTGVSTNNKVQTNLATSSSTIGSSASVGYSVSIKEDSLVCIPANTTKRISEYTVNKTLVRNCDLYRYPRTKEIQTIVYREEKSPIVFGNIIAYESKGKNVIVENNFYVSEVTNYPYSQFYEYKYVEQCGQKGYSKSRYYRFYDTDMFFIVYDKEDDPWKH